ncbi:MAG: biopolymer transporter ExbD [Acidobacteria bacterium]|jgi:biopolymer transport protein ExbD|nr:biopolymer transporter ExbD [Acidobacteriota bacterium]
MSGYDRAHEQKRSPHINVTPLIDVLLVLLIIFMVVTPQKPGRFKAMIPEPPPDIPTPPNPLTLVVTIDKDLRLKLNGSSDDLGSVDDTSKLNEALVRLFQKRRDAGTYRDDVMNPMDLPEEERVVKTVFIKAPRSISYGAVARVIDGVKGAGAQPIGLQLDDLN